MIYTGQENMIWNKYRNQTLSLFSLDLLCTAEILGIFFLAFTDLSIDAMDVSGEQQLDVDHHLFKQRLNADGEKIKDTEPEKEGKY